MSNTTFDFDEIRHNNTVYRLPMQLNQGVHNLMHLEGKKLLTSIGRPLAGKTVLIVSAGPSLDKNIDLVNSLEGFVHVIAVNTARPMLTHTPWLTMTMEQIDVSDQIPEGDTVCAAITANPTTFARAQYFVLDANPWWFPFGDILGTFPYPSGPSVACSSIYLAIRLGAARIVVVGQDLSYDLENGKRYASGTPWGDTGVREEDGVLVRENIEKNNEIRQNDFVPMEPPTTEYEVLDGWGDGPQVKSPIGLSFQRKFFEDVAARHPEIEFLNATEGGAHIQGFRDVPLSEIEFNQTVFPLESYAAKEVSAYEQEKIEDELLRQAHTMHTMALQAGTFKILPEELFKKACGLGEAVAMPVLLALKIKLMQEDAPLRDKLAHTYGAYYSTSERLGEIIDGKLPDIVQRQRSELARYKEELRNRERDGDSAEPRSQVVFDYAAATAAEQARANRTGVPADEEDAMG